MSAVFENETEKSKIYRKKIVAWHAECAREKRDPHGHVTSWPLRLSPERVCTLHVTCTASWQGVSQEAGGSPPSGDTSASVGQCQKQQKVKTPVEQWTCSLALLK